MLQRTILRLSKRKSGLFSESATECKEDWSKYDDRLIDCVNRGDIAKLKHTLNKKNVSPFKLNANGQTVMHLAVKKSQMECVDAILALHPDLSYVNVAGQTVYHIAARNGDVIMLKKLLDYSRNHLSIQDENKLSVLHCAVLSGEVACIKLLLDNNSPLDLKDENNRTPLLLAITECNEKIAMELIIHGADINISDSFGRTAIVLACSQGMSQAVTLLVSKGANSPIAESQEKLTNSGDDISTPLKDEIKKDIDKEFGNQNKTIEETNSLNYSNRNSYVNLKRLTKNFDDTSFTSSIIESLMGLEVTDVGKENNEESLVQNKEKLQIEDMRKELEKKDLKIVELQAELLALHNKVKFETEKRYSAEAEANLVKQQLEDNHKISKTFINKQVVFENGKIEENISKDKVQTPEENLSKDNTAQTPEFLLKSEDLIEDSENHKDDDKITENAEDIYDSENEIKNNKNHINGDSENEVKNNENNNDRDSDSDEFTSSTGYRKKSLGTAKQHIEMLEEHILSLEEDINQRDKEIYELEAKLKSSKELVDLNNNTTVSLELYNQLKVERKIERKSLKEKINCLETELEKTNYLKVELEKMKVLEGEIEKIRGLETKIEKQKSKIKFLEEERLASIEKQTDLTKINSEMELELQNLYQQQKSSMTETLSLKERISYLEDIIKVNTTEKNSELELLELERLNLQNKLNETKQIQIVTTQLTNQIAELNNQILEAEKQMKECEAKHTKQIENYRTLVLQVLKGVLDPKMEEVLLKIALLRNC
ncbi:uveal autoantigen with coiled-coil domains and ankyrin repeats protein isoform X11 [Hydra vulgaris]|uniref:Uveal autoantigen with coiled-coil domains and ankyrin repeats protein isoform X11 n=1 Tax=Hydra vulgaris TaxID=6087 RepID=A0ABM4DDG3_HYDVU